MKGTLFFSIILVIANFGMAQNNEQSETKITDTTEQKAVTKADLVGTWRACGAANWDEEADTLRFQHATPDCSGSDCGEHNWSFRETGSVEFIYTDGCNTGFHSVSKNPKRWIFIEKDQRIKMITNDGYIEYFDVLSLDEKLVLVHRKDLELN